MNPQAEGFRQSRSERDPAKAEDFLRNHKKSGREIQSSPTP